MKLAQRIVALVAILTPPVFAQNAQEALRALIADRGVDAALEAYREKGLPEDDLTSKLGHQLLRDSRFRAALAVLRFNAAAHPSYASAHSDLGEAYEANGQLRWAHASFARAEALGQGRSDPNTAVYREHRDRVAAALGNQKRHHDRAAHVVQVLDLVEGQEVADVGCGSGWLAKAVAKVVGSNGRVYAVEIRKSSVDSLRKRKIANVTPVLSVPRDVKLPRACVDVVFLHDVASHVDRKDRPDFYASIARALRAGGRLVVFKHHGGARKHTAELARYGFVPEEGQQLEGLTDKQLDDRSLQGVRFRYQPRRAVAP